MVEPTWFHKSAVIPTGAPSTRTLAAHFGDVFNVRNFGAVGDGVTDDRGAFQAAFNAANTAGGGVVFMPPGTYRKADTSGGLTMYSNTTLMGVGDASVLFHDDTIANPRRDMLTISNTNNITFRDFKILSTAGTYGVETNNSQCLIGNVVSNLRVENVTFEGLRYMVTAFAQVSGAIFIGNRLKNCMRDGLRCCQSYNVVVTGNTFENVMDDCVALHSLDSFADPVGAGFVVTNNAISSSQTVKILGGKRVVVSGNTFSRMIRTPISVTLNYGLTEGGSPLLDVSITNNVIQDTFSDYGNNEIIRVCSYAYVAGGLTTQPGVNSPPFAYNWLNNMDSSGIPHAGAANIRIEGNTISRTLPAVAAYSSYGYGLMYDRAYTWGYDPAITESSFNCHGITVYGAVRGLRIAGNMLSGLGAGFSAIRLTTLASSSYPDFVDTVIEGNIIHDCPGVGIGYAGGDSGAARNLIIRNNVLDMDPYYRAASHSADNTWSGAGSVLGIQTGAAIKGSVITGNWFAHCGTPISPAPATLAYVRDNFVLCDPNSIADDALNKGVRSLTRQYDFIHVKYDGVPGSATFGEIANMPLTSAASIPTSGWYAAGHFVKAAGLGIDAGGGVAHGWLRLTTGTGHVSGTDWAEVALPNYSRTAGTLTTTGTITAPTFAGALTGNASTATSATTAASATALSAGADRTKLDGIAAGATVNSTDAALRDRATHTGAQAISTVTNLQTTLDAKAPIASPTFTGTATAPQLRGVAALDLGAISGVANTPYIDFNSGAVAVDYDSRIIASGGTGVAGQGTLTYTAGTHVFSGKVQVTLVLAVDDAAAAAAGVAVGGLYHNSGAVRVRLV